ncbi:MAG: hypothetical protein J6S71_00685 [Clostridia bacterium]|nr:hypothetical protein [Clostridia bacterium]
MSYNKNTDWDDKEKHLNNLIKTGNAGEQTWAKNQLQTLAQAKASYGGAGTAIPTKNALNDNMYQATADGDIGNIRAPLKNNQMGIINNGTSATSTPTSTSAVTENTYTPLGTSDDAGLSAEALAQIEALMNAYSEVAPTSASTGLSANDILSWDENYNKNNEQPTYTGKYDPQIDALLNEILTREDFSYNAENDPLYAQFKTMYNREGDRAMRETLAEAAAGAGGMNTYAIAAAQQARNYYASQLNDRIPELYQLAYEMYLQDKESKVEDLGILTGMDDRQYDRFRDTMNDWRADKDFAYGAFTDAVNQGNWETSFNYNKAVDDRDFAYKDYWTNKEWDANEQSAAKDEDNSTPKYDFDDNDNNGYKGITDEIKNKAASITNNNELFSYIAGLVDSGEIGVDEGDKLYSNYVDYNEKDTYSEMVKSTKGWEVDTDAIKGGTGGGNLFGIDRNAVVIAPNGESMTLNELRNKLVAENMKKSEATNLIQELQQKLGIANGTLFGW